MIKKKHKWSKKYKLSIDCNNPRGFSQRQYCKYRTKRHKIRNNKTKRYNKKYVKTKKNKIKNNKTFLYNPNNPKKSFDVYIDKNPNDTIPIKYSTVDDVKKTIKKLERLFKNKQYTHKRIWQVGMILMVRLKAMLKHKHTKYKNAKYVKERYNLANKYFKFLGERTKKKTFNDRKGMIFKMK